MLFRLYQYHKFMSMVHLCYTVPMSVFRWTFCFSLGLSSDLLITLPMSVSLQHTTTLTSLIMSAERAIAYHHLSIPLSMWIIYLSNLTKPFSKHTRQLWLKDLLMRKHPISLVETQLVIVQFVGHSQVSRIMFTLPMWKITLTQMCTCWISKTFSYSLKIHVCVSCNRSTWCKVAQFHQECGNVCLNMKGVEISKVLWKLGHCHLLWKPS